MRKFIGAKTQNLSSFAHIGASKVTAANHWIFAGTGVKNGDIFDTKNLHERIPAAPPGTRPTRPHPPHLPILK